MYKKVTNLFKFERTNHVNIKYWEIWNKPNLDPDDGNKKCWGGTSVQFFDLYEITAKHLKKCFPHLKIGGPSYAGNEPLGEEKWADVFLFEMNKRDVPIDFFLWHLYENEPEKIIALGESLKKLLVKHGYENAESICNEWNYLKDWDKNYTYSMMSIHGLKGASFIAAMMSLAQKSSIDMIMYYNMMYSPWCGAFDMYLYEPLKGYYPFMWYGKFYDMQSYIKCETDVESIYTLCGVDENGKALCVVTNFSDENPEVKDIKLDFGKAGRYDIYVG